MECCNDKDFLVESHPLEGTVLDIDTPTPQMATTSLPDNFQIRTMSDIKALEDFVALNYTSNPQQILARAISTEYCLCSHT